MNAMRTHPDYDQWTEHIPKHVADARAVSFVKLITELFGGDDYVDLDEYFGSATDDPFRAPDERWFVIYRSVGPGNCPVRFITCVATDVFAELLEIAADHAQQLVAVLDLDERTLTRGPVAP